MRPCAPARRATPGAAPGVLAADAPESDRDNPKGGLVNHEGTERNARQPRAVVVGGGLAGITAALQLAESGVHVTLLEAGPGSAASPSPSAGAT
ncbi:tRNA 5-methylaminomethyl-2-thiouridine biosynthesis bifunctional protein MnmC [Streptomyces tanashiensis]